MGQFRRLRRLLSHVPLRLLLLLLLLCLALLLLGSWHLRLSLRCAQLSGWRRQGSLSCGRRRSRGRLCLYQWLAGLGTLQSTCLLKGGCHLCLSQLMLRSSA